MIYLEGSGANREWKMEKKKEGEGDEFVVWEESWKVDWIEEGRRGESVTRY